MNVNAVSTRPSPHINRVAARLNPLLPAIVLGGALLLYAPWICRGCIVTTDRDVLSMLGWLRETNNGVGWAVGYYVNSILTTSVMWLLNISGISFNDYALAYQIVTLGALLGLSFGAYRIVEQATGSQFIGSIAALAVALTPGLVRLIFLLEDNLIDQALQLQYLWVYLWYIAHSTKSARRFGLPEIAMSLSLVLAVNAHHQMNVLWVSLLPLFYFLRSALPRRERVWRIVGIYAFSGAVFLALYVPLTILWAGRFDPSLYLRWVALWFLPNEYYQGFYFFNQFGWDLPRLIASIAQGVTQLVRVDSGLDGLLYAGYLGIFILLAAPFVRHVQRSVAVGAVALFVALNIPHSLIFEPSNLERWDAPVVPAVILIGLTAALVWRDGKLSNRGARWRAWLVFGLVAGILACNATFYFKSLERQRTVVMDPTWQALQPVLLAQMEQNAPRQVLLLSDDEFDRYFMVAEVYFNYRKEIFGMSPIGEVYESSGLFTQKQPVSQAAFRAAAGDAQLVYSPASKTWMEPLVRAMTH